MDKSNFRDYNEDLTLLTFFSQIFKIKVIYP
jgi:hypothetical protein